MRRLPIILLSATILCGMASGSHALRVRAPLPDLSPNEVPQFIEQLKSQNVETQSNAIDNLARVKPIEAAKGALPALIAITKQKKGSADNWRYIYLQTQAIAMLGQLPKTPETTDILFSTADISFSPQECRPQDKAKASDSPPAQPPAYCNDFKQISSSAAYYLPVDETNIGRIKQVLKHPDPQIRNAIIGRFRTAEKLSPASSEILQSAVTSDNDSFVRVTAAQVIAEKGKGNHAFAPALITAIKNEKGVFNKLFYVTALAETGGAPQEELGLFISLLSSNENDSTRYYSARVIGQIGASAVDAVPALINVLTKDSSQLARGYAAEALGKIGPGAKEAIPTLTGMLEDRKTPNYRFYAAEALGKIATKNDKESTKVLIDTLSDQETETQKHAFLALQAQHNNSPEVLKALQTLHIEENNPNASLYQQTLKVLSGDQNASAPLAKPLPEDEKLLSQLKDTDEKVQGAAVFEIKKRSSVEAKFIPGLISALSSKDTVTTWYACEALGKAGNAAANAITPIITMLKLQNSSSTGTQICTSALARIAPKEPTVLDFLGEGLMRGQIFGSDEYAYALSMTGDSGVPYLIRGLRSDNLYTIYLASQGLSLTKGDAKTALPILLETLKAPKKLGVFTTQGNKTSDRILDAIRHIAPDSPELAEALALEKTLPPPTN